MNNDLRQSAKRVQDILHSHNLTANVVEFNELTRTAQEAATVIGCQIGQIAKSLIFKTKITAEPVVVIASGSNRVDEKKIEQYIGQELEKADAQFVVQHTGFAIGGVPPIGYSLTIKPLIDEDLMTYKELWAAAGTPYAVFCLTPNDLVRITGGSVVDVKK